MRETDFRVLQGFQLFRTLAEPDLLAIARRVEILECPSQLVLAREGEMPKFLYILTEGLFELVSGHGGRQTIISFIRPPTAFILAAVVMRQPYLVTARSLVPSRVFALPLDVFHDSLAAHPAIALGTCRELASRYRDMVKELKGIKIRNASQRLANWILTESDVLGQSAFDLTIQKTILASRLSMTNAHLSRGFATLKQHGVALRGRRINIQNRDALRAFAHPDPLIDDILS